jgi:hypothetical protein
MDPLVSQVPHIVQLIIQHYAVIKCSGNQYGSQENDQHKGKDKVDQLVG